MRRPPHVSKSQLLNLVCNVGPGAVFMNDRGSCLTAAVTQDTNKVVLEGGALLLADHLRVRPPLASQPG